MVLVSCSECAGLVDSKACVCPHCDRQLRVCSRKLGRAAGVALLGLSLAGCDGGGPFPDPQPEYGVPFTDEDNDGYEAGEDCNDTDPEINPGAEEIVGDGVDSNCNDDDDT